MSRKATIPQTKEELSARLRKAACAKDAEFLQRFFKTGPGQYGEGDLFLGIRVPQTRRIIRDFQAMALDEAEALLQSPYHEERLAALLVMVKAFERGNDPKRRDVYTRYIRNTARVNNWDLVDLTAPNIAGAWLLRRSRKPLYRMARSPLLWDRRIAIVATHALIRAGDYTETLELSERLLGDREDLMHKACGWMLREVGKRDQETLEGFLRAHCRTMPRTMLRYAIERFEPELRRRYMKGEVGREAGKLRNGTGDPICNEVKTWPNNS